MKLFELKKEISKYQYFEDTDLIDVTLATVVANSHKLGDPVWLVMIGPSSGGKSQVIRPVSLTNDKFMFRVDDLTENTLLSGAAGGKNSLLMNYHNKTSMMVISDLTVLFSKNSESRGVILSQFRMLFDGEMTKYSGNLSAPLEWKGYMGVLAGSTPSIYANFEEVADMGERFVYYRMKPFDRGAATKVAMDRTIFGRELDEKLKDLYSEYIKEVVRSYNKADPLVLSDDVKARILAVADLAERIRTTQHLDWRGTPTRIPVPAMPMRVALQLTAIAKALMIMNAHEGGGGVLNDREVGIVEWCGWSLANEEKRAVLKILASVEYGAQVNSITIANQIGLDTEITKITLQNLAAVGVIKRDSNTDGHQWSITEEADYNLIRKIEGMGGTPPVVIVNAEGGGSDEAKENEEAMEEYFNKNF